MSGSLLLDTPFVVGLLNRHDQHHLKAREILLRVRSASRVLITEAVLVEIGNFLSAIPHRGAAASFIKGCYNGAEQNFQVVKTDKDLIERSLKFYEERPDKSWGLTDCISFVVMNENQTTDAVTTDNHFAQAGYRALMAET